MSADEMIPNSISQWDHQIPYYHHHQTSFQPVTSNMVQQPRINHTVLTPNTTSSGPTIPNPEVVSSPPPCVGELMSPKNGVAKPARRRPRASKKAPTTLLNASLTNFRSLVQQYTGCHSSSSHSPILRNQRGQITLSFGPPAGSSGEQTWHHEQEQQQQQQLMVSYNNNRFLDSSPNNYSGFDKNNNDSNNNSSSKSSNPSTSMLTVDDYVEWP